MSDLYSRKEQLMHRVWLLMIRIAFIFGIPAAVAFFIGRYFDGRFDTHSKFTLIALFPAFILSWVITIYEYKKINAQFAQIKKEEEELKEKHQERLQGELEK